MSQILLTGCSDSCHGFVVLRKFPHGELHAHREVQAAASHSAAFPYHTHGRGHRGGGEQGEDSDGDREARAIQATMDLAKAQFEPQLRGQEGPEQDGEGPVPRGLLPSGLKTSGLLPSAPRVSHGTLQRRIRRILPQRGDWPRTWVIGCSQAAHSPALSRGDECGKT